jgi:UDP-N-acetylmuramoyl-L-alanyl-D-glutamate--2,6-diaminopimelate ligase
MRIGELMPTAPANVASLDVAGITADSRAVAPGYVFAALPGARQDGRRFIADAVANGACAVLAPAGTTWPPGVPPRPLIEAAEPRRELAVMAARLAGPQPGHIAAVTGTNGKTSTVDFLRQIWTLSGKPAASLGTLGLIAPGMPQGDGLTTPDPVSLAETLARLRRAGIAHAAMEASSHGLQQYRLDGVRLEAAAFTNLTRDHLDYHGSMDAYRQAKLRLFDALLPAGAVAVASSELDAVTLDALRRIAVTKRLRLRVVGADGDAIRLLAATPRPDGQELRVVADGTRRTIRLELPGRFQADNALVAAALAQATGDAQALDRLERLIGVRGRLELAARLANGAAVFVDYAHTPDALVRLLTALRPHTEGRLHVVFGAGGDRDPGKRPLMGEAAATHADVVVVTDDNPRSEDPALIRRAVLAGALGARDGGTREAAIASAMADLRPGEVLAVAGKGHEQGQTIAGETLPFDDVAVVRRLAGLT